MINELPDNTCSASDTQQATRVTEDFFCRLWCGSLNQPSPQWLSFLCVIWSFSSFSKAWPKQHLVKASQHTLLQPLNNILNLSSFGNIVFIHKRYQESGCNIYTTLTISKQPHSHQWVKKKWTLQRKPSVCNRYSKVHDQWIVSGHGVPFTTCTGIHQFCSDVKQLLKDLIQHRKK